MPKLKISLLVCNNVLRCYIECTEVLIFDEPTAVLTPQEIEDLIQIMKNLIKKESLLY